MKFKCGCGKKHKMKKCSVIQNYWYTSPHGCTEGDYWSEGPLAVICPYTNNKNIIRFNNYTTPWCNRYKYKFSPEKQFNFLHKESFKEVIEDYNKDTRPYWNNYYFNNRRKKFGLCKKQKGDDLTIKKQPDF